MAINLVQEKGNFNTLDTASLPVQMDGNPVDGNQLIGTATRRIVSASGSITPPTDFAEAVQSPLSGTTNRTLICYKTAASEGATPTYTFVNATSNQEICATVTEYSGLKTTGVLGDVDSVLNSTTITSTTSIAVDTTGTNSLLVFACGHSDGGGGATTSRAFSNSFAAAHTLSVKVDGNDVDHFTATKLVTAAATEACVMSWATTAVVASSALAEFFGLPAGLKHPVDADITDGSWLNQASSNTNLFASVDEVTTDDDDWIQSSLTAGTDVCELGLANVGGTPEAGEVSVKIRHQKVSS